MRNPETQPVVHRDTRRAFLPLLWLLGTALVSAWDWKVAEPGYGWSFPEDHWAHEGYRTEWWYLTGHLMAEREPERIFGYQFTFFRVGLLTELPRLESNWAADSLIMGHAAITDVASTQHRFSELLYREVPLLGEFLSYPEPLIAWARGPVGTAGKWTLRWNGEAFDFKMRDDRQGTAFALETRPAKPLVLQGANGFTRKGREPGAGSLYYSFTRLETRGELSIAGKTWRVHGESWMDREFSSSRLGEQQAGWDWFSIQLLDGQEYMLYLLRRRDGTVDFRHATRVLPDGSPSYLPPGLWSVRSTENWTSPATGAVYPSRWIIRVLGSPSMELTPVIPAQENRSRLTGGLHYWEGAVTVRDMEGAFLGRGYVELTGYGKESRPPV